MSGRMTLPFFICLVMAVFSLPAFPLPAGHYATSSRLSSGRWAKVSVAETGMQFISNAAMKNLGFQNPDKVNVYGYGGRMLPEELNSSTPDDLPKIPSMRISTGIVFFGYATTTWTQTYGSDMVYSHKSNPYSETAYYFISDSEEERAEVADMAAVSSPGGDPLTVFTERVLHEQDLIAPSTTGRLLLGEDFRSQSTRSFPFKLPGNTGDATVKVVFGARVTNGSSSLLMSANGTQLPATNSDKIAGVTAADVFLATTSTVKRVEDAGEKLNLSIQFTYSGAIFTAALDYIEVEYPREIRLADGELYFYVNPAVASDVKVEGCDGSTVIWDVTDPFNPGKVAHTLDGNSALFASPAGYREYVAFTPSKVRRNVNGAGVVANQDIHGMAAPDMVIIAPAAYRNAAQGIADLHAQTDSLKVAVLAPENIYNEFSSGSPDVTAFRKLLKMWYDRSLENGGNYTRYCLLLSRPTYDNKMVTPTVRRAGYPRLPIWQSPSGFNISTSYSTDDYIGMLEDNTAALNMASAEIHVAVGRMPVKSVAEANNALAKLKKYVANANRGSWQNNILVIADDQDNGEHLFQAQKVIDTLRLESYGKRFVFERLYLDSYPQVMSGTGATFPQAKQKMLDKISEGVSIIDYIGHANPREWGHEKLLTWEDITSFSNKNLPFLYAATCEFMNWDDDAVSGAEEMWLNPNAGIIATICPSRKVYISQNGILNKHMAPYFIGKGENKGNVRIGDILLNGKNYLVSGGNNNSYVRNSDSNKLRYGLMGDPAMRLNLPQNEVTVDSINGMALEGLSSLPEIKARSRVRVSGSVRNDDGVVIEDFNGKVSLQLFDAERAIVTYGHGEEGKVVTYNDRKTRLAVCKAIVSNGKWSMEFTLPSEIENNYSPALISLYASDGSRDANGYTEQLYVFGYDQDAVEDNDGPEIKEFYIDSPSFTDGSIVSLSPTVFADLFDVSGINISEAGIGHNMTLTLDGKKVYDDLYLYFDPDDTSTGGKVAYPLTGIEPGRHELSLTVWDNANNSSTSSLAFNVKAGWLPTISNLTTDVNPASSSVTFIVDTDAGSNSEKCLIEVFDLMGKRVWSDEAGSMSRGVPVGISWNLHDNSGARVPRGIYLYRATVRTAEGAEITKTNKLAVTAQ